MSEHPRLRRCDAHGLTFDPGAHAGCVLCRSASARAPRPRAAKSVFAVFGIVVALGLTAAALGRWHLSSKLFTVSGATSKSNQASAFQTAAGSIQELFTRNSFGRSGAYYLPPRFEDGPRPLLLLLHGTDVSGRAMLGQFLDVARQRRIVVIAPESGRSPDGLGNWQVGNHGEKTEDFFHTLLCIEEVLRLPNVRIDWGFVMAAGHSGGGSSAPYVASNDDRFRAFAVLHGGVFPGGLGPNRVRGWFSTGAQDVPRPPSMVRQAAASVGAKALSVEYHEYPGGHGLSERELTEVIAWWLGTG
jgi:poly(3-hydroxybutyrate) depolymerase